MILTARPHPGASTVVMPKNNELYWSGLIDLYHIIETWEFCKNVPPIEAVIFSKLLSLFILGLVRTAAPSLVSRPLRWYLGAGVTLST